MGKHKSKSRGGDHAVRKSAGYVTTRKDGTVYSQDRIRVQTDVNTTRGAMPGDEVEVPTLGARKLISRLGLGDRKFRGTDNVERPIS